MIGFLFFMGILFAIIFVVVEIIIFIIVAIANSTKGSVNAGATFRSSAKISVIITSVLSVLLGIGLWSDSDFRSDFTDESADSEYVWEYDEDDLERQRDDRRETIDTNRAPDEPRNRREERDERRNRDEPMVDYVISASSNSQEGLRSKVYNWSYRDTSLRTHEYSVEIQLLEEDIRLAQQYLDKMNRLAFRWDQELFREVGVSAETDPERVYVAIVQAIYEDDEARFDEIASGFQSIADAEGFDEMELLYFVVTLAQNITYRAPGGETDLLPPTMTLERNYGDCDTVSLLAYVILEKLGYDVAMLASQQYAHAMLGVNAPATGNYVQYDGVKYYTLEMTYPDWWLGEIDSSCQNLRYWYAFKCDI